MTEPTHSSVDFPGPFSPPKALEILTSSQQLARKRKQESSSTQRLTIYRWWVSSSPLLSLLDYLKKSLFVLTLLFKDVISSLAAVTQLLSQAIGLWQQIRETYECIKTRPKLLVDTNTRLSNLLRTLNMIEREPKLRTEDINTLLNLMRALAMELCQRLQKMATIQRKKTVLQSIRVWSHGSRDENKLAGILERLEQAQTDLAIHINVVNVGLTNMIAEEVGRRAQLPEVETRSPIEERKPNGQFLIEGNRTSDSANQLNGILDTECWKWPTTATVRNNRAIQQGRQTNIIAGSACGLQLHQLPPLWPKGGE